MSSSSAGQSPEKHMTPREISETWLEMHGEDYAKEFAGRVKIPDMSNLVSEDYIKSVMPAFTELSKTMSSVAAAAFPTHVLESMRVLAARTAELGQINNTFIENYAEMMKPLTQAINSLNIAPYAELQKSVALMSSTLAASIDTARMQDITARTAALREQFVDQDLDELTDQFFDEHPDLAESIEEAPGLLAFSKMERHLIVAYVRLVVVITITCFILNITEEYPEIDKILAGLGIGGGLQAGKKAAEYTRKVLDKLPNPADN